MPFSFITYLSEYLYIVYIIYLVFLPGYFSLLQNLIVFHM